MFYANEFGDCIFWPKSLIWTGYSHASVVNMNELLNKVDDQSARQRRIYAM